MHNNTQAGAVDHDMFGDAGDEHDEHQEDDCDTQGGDNCLGFRARLALSYILTCFRALFMGGSEAGGVKEIRDFCSVIRSHSKA